MRASWAVAGAVVVASFGWGALASAAELGVGARVDIAGTGVVTGRPGEVLTAGRFRGRVLAMDGETLLVGHDTQGPVRYRWSELRLLRRSEGERSALAGGTRGLARGMGIGALVGAVGGFGLSGGVDSCGSREFLCFKASETIPAAMMYGAACGAGLGFVIGAVFPGERWSVVDRERARISIAPTTGPRGRGAGLAVSVGF